MKRSTSWPFSVAFLSAIAAAQSPLANIGATMQLNPTDMAVLEAHEIRKDLPCAVEPRKPELGFDLKFHAGYSISLPLKEIAGSENMLTILFRVTPKDRGDEQSYFSHHVNVPEIESDAKGDATLAGSFDLGEGSYKVDLLMRDRAEKVCSFYWDSEASLPDKDRDMRLELAPRTVERSEVDLFREEPASSRNTANLKIKILVNFAPQNPNSVALRPLDTQALVTVLRRLAREPQFGEFSVVAFNVQEEKVLYRQGNSGRIDFPALGKAIGAVQPGKVDLKRLDNKHGEVQFLTELIREEMTGSDHPDALIFAGPKVLLDDSVPEDELKPIAPDVDYPVFYVNYNLTPQAVPWKDSISKAIRPFRGVEFTISRPRDLWFTVSDLVSRIVKSKQARNLGSVASSQ